MAEIKSTLDLVMERTKNMILSRDEKQNQDAETAKKHFNGALQNVYRLWCAAHPE